MAITFEIFSVPYVTHLGIASWRRTWSSMLAVDDAVYIRFTSACAV